MCPSGGLCFLCDSSWQRVSLLKNEIRTLIKWEKSCPSSELLCLKAPFQSCLTLFLVFLHELFVCGTPEAVPKYHGLFRRKKIIEVLSVTNFFISRLSIKNAHFWQQQFLLYLPHYGPGCLKKNLLLLPHHIFPSCPWCCWCPGMQQVCWMLPAFYYAVPEG